MSTNVYLYQHHQTKPLREQLAKLKSGHDSFKFNHTALQNELALTQMPLDKTNHDLKATEVHVDQKGPASRLEKPHGELGVATPLYVTRPPDLSPYSANMLLKDWRTQRVLGRL